MPLPVYLLDLPAEEAARLIALALLDRTAEAARRLLDPTDPTALHDFRVAIRRLRSGLQAYRPEIDGSVPGRLRRRVARHARDTARSRDAEVHLAWERDQEPALSERQRAGLRWHLERLEARRRRADRRARHAARTFSRLEAACRRRLERYRLRIERDPSRRRHEAAAVLGGRIRKFAGDLECRLGAVRTMIDEAPAHRARIAAKRLRYLLEPIRSEVDGVEPLIGKLRELQDALGELRDSRTQRAALLRDLAKAGREHERRLDAAVRAGVMQAPVPDEEDDPRPGLLALAERLEEREAEAFARLRADWLAGAADGFFEAVTGAGKRIANRPACVAEIERRFLLRRVPATALAFARQEIEQGWLPGLRLVERITSLSSMPGPATLRTSRPATGAAPSEPDGEVDAELFQAIWPLTAGRRIRKRRHVVSDYGLEWEIDQYLDRELVLLEVAPAADARISLPDWLEPYVVREVTGESDFTARALAH